MQISFKSQKGKGKVHSRTGHEGPKGEQRYKYSSTVSLTSALQGGGWSTPRPGRPGYPLPIVQEAGWAPRPVWKGGEKLAPAGFDPQTVQPVASCYTNYAIPAYVNFIYVYNTGFT